MEEAINAYNNALDYSAECSPKPTVENLSTIHLNCARAYAKQSELVRSLEMCTQALELQPKYVSGLVQRAVVRQITRA